MMTREVTLRRCGFTLSGPDAEPVDDPAWTTAAPSERRAYFRELARELFEERRRANHKAEAADGSRLPPRRRRRRDGATGPVLVPHFGDSRFNTLMRYQGTERAALVWWVQRWAKVVYGHASGEATGIKRDVVGLSRKRVAKAVERARKWWAGRFRRGQILPWQRRAETMVPVPPGAGPAIVVARSSQTHTRIPTPTFAPDLPPWTVVQRLDLLLHAASDANAVEGQIGLAVGRLAVLPVPTLRDVAMRLGILPPPADKPRILQLIERTLLQRLKEARRLRGGPPTAPPLPPRPPRPPAMPARVPTPPPVLPDLTPLVLPPLVPTGRRASRSDRSPGIARRIWEGLFGRWFGRRR